MIILKHSRIHNYKGKQILWKCEGDTSVLTLSNFPWNKKKKKTQKPEGLFYYEIMYSTWLTCQQSNRKTIEIVFVLGIRYRVSFLSRKGDLGLVRLQTPSSSGKSRVRLVSSEPTVTFPSKTSNGMLKSTLRHQTCLWTEFTL